MSTIESDGKYSIGQTLEALRPNHPDLSISKLRFLEKEGLIAPERTPSGYRRFTAADIDQLDRILTMQSVEFLPLKEIRRRLQEPPPPGPTVTQLLDSGATLWLPPAQLTNALRVIEARGCNISRLTWRCIEYRPDEPEMWCSGCVAHDGLTRKDWPKAEVSQQART